jgi:50S ribosome-binding GTPase
MGEALVPRIVAVCDAALAQIGEGEARSRVEAVRRRLREPLRIAVGGRIKAGKSTLVNALLGRQAAATDVSECTRVVAEYRYGLQDRIEVVPRQGEPWTLTPNRDGAIPADIGAPADDIERLIVSMTVREPLERMTIIDTPGLFSTNAEYSANTKRFLGAGRAEVDLDSRRAVSQTEGLVYLMPHPSEDDREFLETLQAMYPESRIGATNVVGVLSKIDMLGSGRGDPWPQARKVAANYERKLRSTVTRVVPVAGLLAETAVGDAFTETEMRDLRAVAELEPSRREAALESVDEFRSSQEIDLGAERRERLLAFFGLYGLRESLRLIDDGARSAAVLLESWRTMSGIGELRRAFDQALGARADPLRADRALNELEQICFRYRDDLGPESARIRGRLESIRLDPALHFISETDVLRDVDSGAVSLPRDYERELVRVAKSTTADAKLGLERNDSGEDRARLALERVAAWQRLENDPSTSPQQARAARVIRESFEQIYFEAAR